MSYGTHLAYGLNSKLSFRFSDVEGLGLKFRLKVDYDLTMLRACHDDYCCAHLSHVENWSLQEHMDSRMRQEWVLDKFSTVTTVAKKWSGTVPKIGGAIGYPVPIDNT